MAMVFSPTAAAAELVALAGCACLPATTSFEFLIRKPPCNYWINVNYESWLGLRHRYRYHRTRVELSLFLPLLVYTPVSLSITLSHSARLYFVSFRLDLERCLCFLPPPSLSLAGSLSLSSFIQFNPLSFLLQLSSVSATISLFSLHFSTPFLRRASLFHPYSFYLGRGWG